MGQSFVNAARRSGPIGPPPPEGPRAFHRRLPGYAPTRLVAADALARELGTGEILIKLEVERFGLPAFKILGSSWATYRLLARELELGLEDWRDLDELRARIAPLLPRRLVTATDGNHGRGVARVARLLGLGASVFVPQGTSRARIEGIRSEGAAVTAVDGPYDQAVAAAAREAGPRAHLIQDTSWDGYEEVPGWVFEGYETMLAEIDEERAALGRAAPDVVLVPVGVGALLAAVLSHATWGAWPDARFVTVEPLDADCTLAALRADRVVTVEGPHRSMMVGLCCGTLATTVWPLVRAGVDAAIAIEEETCAEAVRTLHRHGLDVGESGASSLAGLLALLRDDALADARRALGLGPESRVLVFATEGVTDPESWRRVVHGPGPAAGERLLDSPGT